MTAAVHTGTTVQQVFIDKGDYTSRVQELVLGILGILQCVSTARKTFLFSFFFCIIWTSCE